MNNSQSLDFVWLLYVETQVLSTKSERVSLTFCCSLLSKILNPEGERGGHQSSYKNTIHTKLTNGKFDDR